MGATPRPPLPEPPSPGRAAGVAEGEPGSLRRSAPAAGAERVVAVTGASGFLGRNLVGLLEEDEQVRRIVALDTEPPETAGRRTRHYEVDLTDPTASERLSEILAAERVDAVVHLAFLDLPTPAAAWAHELESVGTLHLLNACRRAQVRKLVLWSQTLLYGAHPTNPNFLTEAHPLRARRSEPFFANKIEAETEALRFGKPGKGRVVTVLRTAPILGPTVDNAVTRYLARRRVPTLLGFDPLWQCVHEADATAAFKLAVLRDAPGIFNICAEGVLPLSKVIRLAGAAPLPLPRAALSALSSALWLTQAGGLPPAFLDLLQYLCVADGEAAGRGLGFSPLYTTREVITEFAAALRLRQARLLAEPRR